MDKEDIELMNEIANAGRMNFKSRLKYAIKKAYKINPVLFIKVCVVIFLVIFMLLIIIGIVAELENQNQSINTDESMISIGTDYVVNTSISEADIIVTDRDTLINAINSLGYSEQAKINLIDNIDAFLGIQEQYNVNAVFGMAVTLIETSAGTNWDLVDSNTYNWINRQKGSTWTGKTYTDKYGTEWRWYSSFEEATYDFGSLIGESSYYFGGENYTVKTISKSYCQPPEQWANGVINFMTDIFEACGIDTSKYKASATGIAIANKATELYMIMYEEEYGYNQRYHSSTPPVTSMGYCQDKQHVSGGIGRHTKLTDCSGFVNWVLYELGVGKFTLATAQWINFDPNAYRFR